MAYGTGVICWRGASAVTGRAPLVSTPICNQLVAPVNAPGPKSICTVNRPLVMNTALLVTGPAVATPVVLGPNSEKGRLKVPLACLLQCVRHGGVPEARQSGI